MTDAAWSGLAVALAAGASLVATGALVSGRGLRILDHPNERSLHAVPTPRTGGLGIVLGLSLGAGALLAGGLLAGIPMALAAGAALVLAVSLADDLRGVAPLGRLCVQILAAGLLLAGGLVPAEVVLPGGGAVSLGVLGPVFALLYVVWHTNLYNFMDGMDGFAGGMGVVGFAACAGLAWAGGSASLAALAAVIAGACLGFLAWNFPPARIFMGDSGSSVLGFLAAGVCLHADVAGIFPLWLGVLVFSPFIVDATVTLVRRTLKGEQVWVAHRSHLYQRLVGLGWSHRRTVLHEYALMLACAATALALPGSGPGVQVATACAWAAIYAMLAYGVVRLERSKSGIGESRE